MFDIRSEITGEELREMLEEAEIDVDEALFEGMRAMVQPMRATLRGAEAGRRRSLLRGALLDAQSIAKNAPVRRLAPRPTHAAREDEAPGFSWGRLVARLLALWASAVAALFAVMTMWDGPNLFSLIFGALSATLLFLAITGRGMGARNAKPGKFGVAKGILGVGLLMFTGIGPFLILSVRSLVDPRFHADADFMTRVVQGIGLVTLVIVVTHFRNRARSRG